MVTNATKQEGAHAKTIRRYAVTKRAGSLQTAQPCPAVQGLKHAMLKKAATVTIVKTKEAYAKALRYASKGFARHAPYLRPTGLKTA